MKNVAPPQTTARSAIGVTDVCRTDSRHRLEGPRVQGVAEISVDESGRSLFRGDDVSERWLKAYANGERGFAAPDRTDGDPAAGVRNMITNVVSDRPFGRLGVKVG